MGTLTVPLAGLVYFDANPVSCTGSTQQQRVANQTPACPGATFA